jgi:hypothetical protein
MPKEKNRPSPFAGKMRMEYTYKRELQAGRILVKFAPVSESE